MTGIGIDIGGSSVKAALLADDGPPRTGRSATYQSPDADTLADAIRQAIAPLLSNAPQIASCGLCMPGRYDPRTRAIAASINLPALNGLSIDDLLRRAGLAHGRPPAVFSDAHAAAYDHWSQSPNPGRLLALSLGTGVGAAVLDDGQLLTITGPSSGHLGQIDVSIEANPADAPIGPDGGRGGLEAYIGASAIAARYGDDPLRLLDRLTPDDPPIRALVRAIRICHAIYRPHAVALLGGGGCALARLLPEIKAAVDDALTSIARQGWTLRCGTTDHHAAIGAAPLAARANPDE